MVWTGVHSLLSPSIDAVTPNVTAYVIILLSLVLNYLLMNYKGIVGRITGNLSLLSDSKDSEINIVISLGVLVGYLFAVFDLYVVDTVVGILIGLFCIKEAVEIITEMAKRQEDFDIADLKVGSDVLFNDRLTGFILGSIRRATRTPQRLFEDFHEGLELGRVYYRGMADFFYKELDVSDVQKRLDLLIRANLIEIDTRNNLTLTSRGLKHFYEAKATEYSYNSRTIEMKGSSFLNLLSFVIIAKTKYIVVFLIIGFLIFLSDKLTW